MGWDWQFATSPDIGEAKSGGHQAGQNMMGWPSATTDVDVHLSREAYLRHECKPSHDTNYTPGFRAG